MIPNSHLKKNDSSYNYSILRFLQQQAYDYLLIKCSTFKNKKWKTAKDDMLFGRDVRGT